MNKYYYIACLMLVTACEKTKPEPQQPVTCTASYVTDVKPVIAAKCAVPDCHGSNGLANLADYAVLKTMADNGKVRKYVFELKMMPPVTHTQLTEAEKEKLKCWLDNGAQQN